MINRSLRIVAASVALLSGLPAQLPEQASEVYRVDGETVIEWFGHQGRTYFMQVSDDSDPLRKWIWSEVIEPGNDENISYEFGGTSPRGFARLQYTDATPPLGVSVDDWDPDGDGISNIYELLYSKSNPLNAHSDDDGLDDGDDWAAGGDPNLSDTDGDGLNDAEEVAAGSWPRYPDPDGDGLNDYEEVVIWHTDPWFGDTDEDGLPDGWEATYQLNPLADDTEDDADDDQLSNGLEYKLSLNPRSVDTDGDTLVDGDEDFDRDGLSNLAELEIHGTLPRVWDTDDDGMPDGWEVVHTLDPNDAVGVHGHDGDPDSDSLVNFNEWLHNTNPRDPDTDGDNKDDGPEIFQGSNPNDNGDQGVAPPDHLVKDVMFSIGDSSDSRSEKWKLVVKGLGPDDRASHPLANDQFGVIKSGILKLRKWNQYEVTIEHLATKPEYLESHENRSNYDWEAKAGANPSSESQVHAPPTTGVNNFFMVGDHWLVDNRQVVFTSLKSGGLDNLVEGKKAFLVPVEIGDNFVNGAPFSPSGVDETSVTAYSDSPGYQGKFWIMAPMGGSQHSNEMYFKIPLDPPAPLDITCLNATSAPTAVSLGKVPKKPTTVWQGSGTDTSDNIPEFKIGDAKEVVDLPIRVKSMKKRTVKIGVYPVRHSLANPHIPLPNKQRLQNELNRIFGGQVNAWFEVDYKAEEQFDYTTSAIEVGEDDNGVKYYEYLAVNRSSKETSMITDPKFVDSSKDIIVFVLDKINYYVEGAAATGASYPPNDSSLDNRCVVNARWETDGEYRPEESVIHTIAHEIGHVLVGGGHPDDTIVADRGAAALNGASLNGHPNNRLLCSGNNSTPLLSTLLVKGEWDSAEAWLSSKPTGDN